MSNDIGGTYIYYKKEILREHMLYQSEISQKYGLKSTSGKPHPRLVGAIMQEYYRQHTDLIDEEYYYQTSNGLLRVYQESIYRPAIIWFANYLRKFGANVEEVSIDGTTYKFKWKYFKIN
jgi:hypothetical protein